MIYGAARLLLDHKHLSPDCITVLQQIILKHTLSCNNA